MGDPRPLAVFVGFMVIVGGFAAYNGRAWGWLMLALAFLIVCAVGGKISWS